MNMFGLNKELHGLSLNLIKKVMNLKHKKLEH